MTNELKPCLDGPLLKNSKLEDGDYHIRVQDGRLVDCYPWQYSRLIEDALQVKCRKWHLACKFLVKLIKRDFDWIYRLRKSRGKGLTLDALYLYEAMADTEKNLQAKVDKLVEALRYIREEAYDTPDSWGGGIFIEDAKLKQELYKNTGLCNTWCEESVTLADYINQALKDAGEVPND